MPKNKLTLLLSLLGGFVVVAAPSAFSQQLPGATPGTQTDDALPRLPARVPTSKLIKVAPEAAPAPAATTGALIPVTQFRFSGNTSRSADVLAPLVAQYVGKSLTLDQLNEAADAVRGYYRKQGWFLAQAYIPAQAAKNGVIEIAVLEGRIDKVTIKVAPDAPISAAYAEKLATTFLHSGQDITEGGIERPLLLLRDVPRVDAKSVIDPGSEVGTASIVVNVVKDPDAPIISGQVALDNFGSRVSGVNRLGAEVNVNNPYGLGDQLSLRGFLSNTGGNGFGRAAYSLPVGAWGTRLGVSAARLNYVLGEQFSALDANGVANVFSANASHPLIRSKDHNLFAQFSVERKKLTDRTTTPAAEEGNSLTSAHLQLNGDSHDSLAGVNVYSVSFTRGDLSIDNSGRQFDDQNPVTGAHTAGSFSKLVYSFQRLQQFMPGLHGMFSVSGQFSDKNLHSGEKFSIGGDSTVRAFPVGELVGDAGYTATAELRYAIPQLKKDKLNVVGTTFYDFGHITKNHDNALLKSLTNTRSISGYGVGLNLGYGDNYLLKLAVAWPGTSASENEPNRTPRIWAQASYGF